MNPVEVRQHASSDDDLGKILRLIQQCFAYMDGRVDPPSSMHRLAQADIAAHCDNGEVWSIGDPPVACVFLQEKDSRLYVGKLAVEASHRGQGLARVLIRHVEDRALALGLNVLELKVRVELIENQSTFEKMGFSVAYAGRHDGYREPTFLAMRKALVR